MPEAKRLFFERSDETSLYYADNIRQRIENEFAKELRSRPERATGRRNSTWTIETPRFLMKAGQQVNRVSRIRVSAEAYLVVAETPPISFRDISGGIIPTSFNDPSTISIGTVPEDITIVNMNPLGVFGRQQPEQSRYREVNVASSRSDFDVTWRITVRKNGQLTNKSLISIDYVETVWG